jgi:hypothetical protein
MDHVDQLMHIEVPKNDSPCPDSRVRQQEGSTRVCHRRHLNEDIVRAEGPDHIVHGGHRCVVAAPRQHRPFRRPACPRRVTNPNRLARTGRHYPDAGR